MPKTNQNMFAIVLLVYLGLTLYLFDIFKFGFFRQFSTILATYVYFHVADILGIYVD